MVLGNTESDHKIVTDNGLLPRGEWARALHLTPLDNSRMAEFSHFSSLDGLYPPRDGQETIFAYPGVTFAAGTPRKKNMRFFLKILL